MNNPVPPFIPEGTCLRCRGCCRFNELDSVWQVRLTVDEEIGLERQHSGCSHRGCLQTVPDDNQHVCVFLSPVEHTCRVYATRPLECAVYPFLLSPAPEGVRVFVHLACPWVEEVRHTKAWDAVWVQLKDFLLSSPGMKALRDAYDVYPDYSGMAAELALEGDIIIPNVGLDLLARRKEIEAAIKLRPVSLAVRSFANLFAWAGMFALEIGEIKGALCIVARRDGASFLYFPPLCREVTPDLIDAVFHLLGSGGAVRIEGISREERSSFADERYQVRQQGEEYVYDRQAIVSLKGQPYRSQRSEYNFFIRGGALWRPYTAADALGCARLFERWLDNRYKVYEDDVYRAMLLENRTVHRRLIAHAELLGLIGRVVERKNQIIGYTFGRPAYEDTFAVDLEITEPGVKGLPVFIFREFCADEAVRPFKYINVMDDFGLPAVAAAKRKWRPLHMEPFYSVQRKG